MKRTLIRLTIAAALGMALGFLMAAQPAPSAPIIKDSLKAKFWKAQAEFTQAQQAAQQATQTAQQKQVQLQAAMAEMEKSCGARFDLKPDANNDPICVEKPKAKEEPKK